MKNINVAVIGVGYWGPNLVRNLLKIPHVSQVYACDAVQQQLTSLGKSYPNVITTNDYSEILNNPNIDAVIIATPIKTHFTLAKAALKAKKHVLVEKPITSTVKEAKELIQLAESNQVILMSGHTFIYSETVKKMKQVIEKKQLGKIYYYDSSRINLGIIQKDSNVIWDLAPHDLSIISYLFAEKPLSVQAFGSTFISNKEELAHIFITFEKNISAHIAVSWLSPVKIRSIIIGGSKKMIVCNEIEPSEKIKIYDKGIEPQQSSITPFAPAYRSGDVIIPRLEQTESLFNELSHFVDCIRKNKQPITDGKAGLQVVVLLEAIEKALQTHKKVTL